MIRRSPAENYYKYLVVHPAMYDDEYIKSVAYELGLDWLGDWYIQWLRDCLSVPTPFFPSDVEHTKSRKFLQREGLTTAFFPTPAWHAALRIMSKPRQREVVETLLVAHAPQEAICYTLKERHGTSITTETIRLYKHYFWNIDILDSNEFRIFLDMRHHGALDAFTDTSRLSQLASRKRMRHTDPRVVAARLPHTPLAATIAQLELGVLPQHIDLSAALSGAMKVAAVRTLESALGGGPVASTMLSQYAMAMESLKRGLDAVVNPEEKLRKDLKRAALATTQQKVPLLKQLTDGNHTTNVYPEPKVVTTVIDAEFDAAEADEDEDDSEAESTDEGQDDREDDDNNEP